MSWPHDDTGSLVAFYGDPRRADFARNLVLVVPPWPMTYAGRPIRGVQIHRKCADSLKAVFDDIALQVGHDWSKLPPGAVAFSGSYNFRPVRGSANLSCHAFGAAIDMDAAHNPMNYARESAMSEIVIGAFKRQGWYWGGDFHSRQDPMHFQAANEASRVAELASEVNPVGTAQAAEMPPMTDGHGESLAAEAALPRSSIEEISVAGEVPAGKSDKVAVSLRTAAAASVGGPVAAEVAKSFSGQVSDIADQVTQTVDKSGNVIAVTKHVVSIAKPGFWNGLLHTLTSAEFLLIVIIFMGAAWAGIYFWQRAHRPGLNQ